MITTSTKGEEHMTQEQQQIAPEQVPTTEKNDVRLSDFLYSEKVMDTIRRQISDNVDIKGFLSNAIMDISKDKLLQQCTRASILQCAIDAMNFGLVPNKVGGQAYLIPYKNKGVYECTLMIGYKGYIKKFADNNMTVELELVTHEEIEGGFFKEVRGSNPSIYHSPIRRGIKTPDNIALGYVIGRKEGRRDVLAVMSFDEIMEAGKCQVWENNQRVSKHKGVWLNGARSTDFAEMCKKTLVRRLGKLCDIDIINRMSSYEGTREDRYYKNITPSPVIPDAFTQFMPQQTPPDATPANEQQETPQPAQAAMI
jgi:recombination protein RecT